MSGIPDPRRLLLMDKLDNRVGEESKHILRLYEFFLVPYTCQVKMRKEWDLNISAVLIDSTAHKWSRLSPHCRLPCQYGLCLIELITTYVLVILLCNVF